MDYPLLKGKHILIRYMQLARSVAEMVLEHYDRPQFSNTVFVLNTLDTYEDIIRMYPDHNCIYYQMEHLNVQSNYAMDTINRLSYYPTIWDIDFNNVRILKSHLQNEIYFMPVRYTSYFDDKYIGTNSNPTFDLCFYGVISQERMRIMNEYSYNFEFNKTIVFWGKSPFEVPDLIRDCKFVVNLHQVNYEQSNQEQVRIFELISTGKSVISAPSRHNYFGNLIKECDPFEIHKKFKLYSPVDNSKKYKELTYSDENYEKYRSSLIKEFQYS